MMLKRIGKMGGAGKLGLKYPSQKMLLFLMHYISGSMLGSFAHLGLEELGHSNLRELTTHMRK